MNPCSSNLLFKGQLYSKGLKRKHEHYVRRKGNCLKKKNPNGTSKAKNYISEMINSLHGLNSR